MRVAGRATVLVRAGARRAAGEPASQQALRESGGGPLLVCRPGGSCVGMAQTSELQEGTATAS